MSVEIPIEILLRLTHVESPFNTHYFAQFKMAVNWSESQKVENYGKLQTSGKVYEISPDHQYFFHM